MADINAPTQNAQKPDGSDCACEGPVAKRTHTSTGTTPFSAGLLPRRVCSGNSPNTFSLPFTRRDRLTLYLLAGRRLLHPRSNCANVGQRKHLRAPGPMTDTTTLPVPRRRPRWTMPLPRRRRYTSLQHWPGPQVLACTRSPPPAATSHDTHIETLTHTRRYVNAS